MAATRNAWPLKRLKDITSKIGSGATPRGGKNGYRSEGISLIRSLNVYDFSFTEEDLAFIGDEQAAELNNVIVQKDDILLNITGASVARCCLTNPKFLPARVNQHVAIVRVRPDVADARFVLYCINSLHFKSRLLALAQGGATREALTKTTIEDFEVCQPPLLEQRRIGGILSAYDELIENSQQRIKILESMARNLYREWFVQFRFPGHEKVKLVSSSLGKIPEGWEVKKLGDLTAYLNRGLSPNYDENGDSMVINQKCIRDQRLNLEPARRQTKPVPPDKWVRFGDILINSTGVGTLGRVAQVYQDLDECTVDTHVTIARPNSETDLDFFGCTLLSLQETFERLGIGATGQTELSRTSIANVEQLVPTIGIQRQFGEQVRPLRSAAINLAAQIHNLRKTRNLLLPRLLSGQISLTTKEN